MARASRPWAAAASILLHGAALAFLLWKVDPEPPGAKAAGLGGIEVALGPAGAAAATTPVEPVSETVEPVSETIDTPTPVNDAIEPAPPPPDAVETRDAETIDPTVTPPEDADAAPVETVTAIEALDAPPIEAVETVEAVPEMVTVAAIEPPKKKKEKMERKPEAVATPAPTQQAAIDPAATTAPAPTVTGQAGMQSAPDAGSGDATPGGGLPGDAADYFSLLQAWLERHKEYPRSAKLRRIEGTALLRFVIDREGRVLVHRIQRSSGHETLDHAVEAMIERATPLPPMPAEMTGSKLELVVPVEFVLR